jgi:acyl dehydratase
MSVEIGSFDQLGRLVGTEVAVGEWFTVTPERIDAFATVTEDRQWIHVDQERAGLESPYGTTIAHGFLTLSLLTHFLAGAVRLTVPLRMVINYGLDRVRFISPVRAGTRLRPRIRLERLEVVAGGHQATWGMTIEPEEGTRPVAVAEWLVRYYV